MNTYRVTHSVGQAGYDDGVEIVVAANSPQEAFEEGVSEIESARDQDFEQLRQNSDTLWTSAAPNHSRHFSNCMIIELEIPEAMNTKHTPGPWQVDETYTSMYMVTTTKARCPVAEVMCASDMYSCIDPTQEEEANAKLIAAAPDLLEALRELVSDCEMASGLISDSSYYEHDLDAARRAIAKATT